MEGRGVEAGGGETVRSSGKVLGGEVLPHAAAERQGIEEQALDAAAEEAEAEAEVEVEVDVEAL